MPFSSLLTERKHSFAHCILGWADRGGEGAGYEWGQRQCTVTGEVMFT